ncbi:hypothetical protein CHO01_21010 [Cellulomonas hominis]|uniref:Uncharacterized protein n=1 Tax=Cellulomonas hominis TaxID=156981 RepID=A0A511FCL2_9CELL|nr:hypothetical protein [Cellulomonas hominis]MBB5472890.1 hypothetical protein [Cellulomonas hominis]NKY05706.1 hypothetical protein [Cellulomonas hominis]GEL46985.1 hypothetical protein CHO01_21010 [Cellulomonas hominis]
MSDPVDPMRTPGRWLVTTASGAAYLIEATDPDSAVTATRVVAGPIGDDLRFPRAALRRDDQPLRVMSVQHSSGTTMSNGIVVGQDMWLYLEPLDPAAALTLRRTTPVVGVAELPTVVSDR